MGYASKEGRARINSRSPSAAGQCDRCGFIYDFSHLRWQMDYSGAGIYNKRILVCEKCYDTPQQQLKVIVIPPDPLPVLNARPPDYVTASTDYRYTSGQNTIDPVTGIPIVQGDIRETNPTTALYNFQEGAILMEDLTGYLIQETGGVTPLVPDGYLLLLEEAGAALPAADYLRVTQQTGEPPGGLNKTPGSNFQVPGNDEIGLPKENVVIPYTGPLQWP